MNSDLMLLGDDFDELAGYGEQIIGDDFDDDVAAILSGMSDDDDMVGAIRRKKAKRANLMRAKMALRGVKNRELRKYPLGLGATNLGAGATAIIGANPQLPFRVRRLVTASVNLLIENIQVGTQSQFVAAGAVPTEVFAPNSFDVDLKGDTAVPGVQVQLTVSNPTAGALVFSGAIIGDVAQ